MDSGFYIVNVKLEKETNRVDSEGKPKMKKSSEKYLVKAGAPEIAVKITEKAMEGCLDSWRIDMVKEFPLNGILGD